MIKKSLIFIVSLAILAGCSTDKTKVGEEYGVVPIWGIADDPDTALALRETKDDAHIKILHSDKVREVDNFGVMVIVLEKEKNGICKVEVEQDTSTGYIACDKL